MEWVPESAWLTKLEIDSNAADLRFDLAVDTSGNDTPSLIDAGLAFPIVPGTDEQQQDWAMRLAVMAAISLCVLVIVVRRPFASRGAR
jgi:hypothetical protein